MKINLKHMVPVGIAIVFFAVAAVLGGSMIHVTKAKEAKVTEDEVLATDVFAGSGTFMRDKTLSNTAVSKDISEVSVNVGSATVAQATVEAAEVSVVSTPEEVTEEAVENKSDAGEWSSKVMAKVTEAANIRATADSEGELVGHFPEGAAGDIIERGEEWTQITSGSVTGYVKNEFLAFDEEAKQLAEARGRRATVNTETLRIRSSADENSSIVELASVGDVYGVVSEDASWVAVSVDDTTGYMAAEFVTITYNLEKATSIQEEKEEAEEAARAKEEAEKEKAAKEEKATKKKAAEESKSETTEVTMRESTNASVDDVTLLGALVQVEAGGQSYECQLAVASTIINRVNSSHFPNSISGVIYQSGQYPPAHNGKVARVLANGVRSSCLSVAQEAINGKNNIGSYVQFNMSSAVSKDRLSDYIIIDGECFY